MKNNSKVIMAIFLIIVVAIMLIFVFKPFKSNNEVKNEVDNNVATEYVDIRYEAHTMESSKLREDENIIISSYDDLVKYTSTVEDEFLLDMLKMYDEEYFMGESLIVIAIRDDLEIEPISSVKKELNSNSISVVLNARELEEFVTPNMVMNNIVIEVNSEDVQEISGLDVKLME